jgi:hypothetical protein
MSHDPSHEQADPVSRILTPAQEGQCAPRLSHLIKLQLLYCHSYLSSCERKSILTAEIYVIKFCIFRTVHERRRFLARIECRQLLLASILPTCSVVSTG